MVWRVAVLSARRCSGARPSAAVCRFVSSQVWQIIYPLLSCDLPPLPMCCTDSLLPFLSIPPLLPSSVVYPLLITGFACFFFLIESSVTPSEGFNGQSRLLKEMICVFHSSVNLKRLVIALGECQ